MNLDWFLWDDRTIAHVARHGLRPEEVDETLENDYRTLTTRNGFYMLLGRSAAGRYISIIFDLLGDGKAWVITARDMTQTEKRRYSKLL